MSRIKSTGESIKKKLFDGEMTASQHDIASKETSQQDVILDKTPSQHAVKSISQHVVKSTSQQNSKKKVTFYISLEIEKKLNEVYTKKMMKNEKQDKSSLISRAIQLLWKEEKNYDI